MIKFATDNGQSFEYPESLSDVTLKQYLEYLEFVESTKPKVLKDIAINKISNIYFLFFMKSRLEFRALCL
jgi:hypothetical protein